MSNEGNGSARNALRAKLLNKKTTKAKSVNLKLFGEEVEFRQPTLRDILRAKEEDDEAKRAAKMIVEYVFVPGTNERLFEEGDIPAILEWPFGEDMSNVMETIQQLTGVDIKDAEQEIQQDPLGDESSSSPVN